MLKLLAGRLLPLNFFREKLGVPSQKRSLEKLRKLGFSPEVILDIGAYIGEWSAFAKKIFPEASFLMIEGQRNREPDLRQLAGKNPGFAYRIALLGAEKKNVTFNIYETASSVLTEDNVTNAHTELRRLELLDELLAGTPFSRPDLVKLDCQGYELEILKGGTAALEHATAVLMEVSLLQIYKGCPLPDEVLAFMKARGFALYDICTLMYRPYDKALYQSDLLFVREDAVFRSSSRWS